MRNWNTTHGFRFVDLSAAEYESHRQNAPGNPEIVDRLNMIEYSSQRPYRGRFAPSPSGPLHFGSLYTALASYLDAHANQGTWLVRIEDLDPPREQPGATESILKTLEKYGLHWQEPVMYQSQRSAQYDEAIYRLKRQSELFYCTCSRKQLASHPPIYPGFCRAVTTPPAQPYAIRFKASGRAIAFDDRLQGKTQQNLAREVGDFLIQRKGNLYAYQLAVVVDDASQNISHVLRGSDLLDNTPRQIALQDSLGYTRPNYLHLPLITNQRGQKLSKQTFADSIENLDPPRVLTQLLSYLGQNPPQDMEQSSVEEILGWAVAHWNCDRIPTQAMQAPNSLPLCP